MERFKVYSTYKGFAWILVVTGVLLAIFGGAVLIRRLTGSEDLEISLISSVTFFVQGILLAVLGWMNLRSGKYFLEWSQKEIRCYLPANKQIETFQLEKISGVDIRLYEIQLTMGDETRTINLEHANFEDIRSIKDKFEEIKRNVET
jgi:hypothetical protein